MHSTTSVFPEDVIIDLADTGGNTVSIAVPEIKTCLRFHSLITEIKFYSNIPGMDNLVKPLSYRIIVANYLNNDPLIFNKRIIHESGATEHPACKGEFRLDSLLFDHPDPRLIHDVFGVFEKFGSSKTLAENTMQLKFIEETEKVAQPRTPYSRGRQQKKQLRSECRQNQEDDVTLE